ncbi:MAG: hypothetical protein ABIY63_07845 [Fibrobacteria bacterium]
MNSTKAILTRIKSTLGGIIGFAGLIVAIGNAHAGEDSASVPSPFRWSRLLPRQILAGPQVGVMGSRFIASADYRSLVEPTPAKRDGGAALSMGVVATARWSHWFSLSVAPHRETYAMETRERTVAFPDNPFPHTLRASTNLTYNVWPILFGIGWFTPRQHFQFQLGTYKALLDEAHIRWTVDGSDYPNMPPLSFAESISGMSFGSEYGFRLGSGNLVIGAETQREFQSMMEGMEGSIKARSIRLHLDYVWNVWRR